MPRPTLRLSSSKGDFPATFPKWPSPARLRDKAGEQGAVGILDLLINTGLAPNRKQAQRLVEQGGVKVDDEKVSDRTHLVTPVAGMIVKAGRSFVRLVD